MVYEANMLLPKYGLVTFTWGNVSQIDKETGYFAIKPSGVDYDKLTPDDMVIMDAEGNKIEENTTHLPIHLHILSFIKHFQISAVSYIHIPHGPRAGHRPEGESPAMAPLTRIICMEKSHASDA